MTFHEKIKQCREESELSQENVAEQLHVSRQAVSKWERGINQPDIETIVRLSDLFGVTVDQLLRGDMIAVRKLAVKERSFKWLIIGSSVLIGALLLFLLLSVNIRVFPVV